MGKGGSVTELPLCPECQGRLRPRRNPRFMACGVCGHLTVVKPLVEEKSIEEGLAELVPPDSQEDATFEVPDFTEVMVGWRAWGVPMTVRDGELPILTSVTYGEMVWLPGEFVEATCGKNRSSKGHEVPNEDCSCGLYSAKTRAHLMSMGYHRYDADQRGMFHVVGEVSLWGKIVEGTQGWRAQRGYPRKLFVPFEAWHLAKPLKEAYGVPVKLNNILGTEAA